MASPTPTKPRVVDSTNPYSSKVIKIAVGPQKIVFSIHKAFLEKLTSFFDVHGGLLNSPARQNSAQPSETSSDDAFVPLAKDGDVAMKTEEGIQVEGNSEGKESPVNFTIDDRFHTVGAFQIVTSWLYNRPPKTPANRIQCKKLLQAYVLARHYKAYDLQNLILDQFRDHHCKYNLDLDNLVWLANRIGDNTEDCALTAYFVEQAAFEIVNHGYEEFEHANLFFKTFLAEGDWTIRLELVKALAKHAQASGGRLGDPAKSLADKWHVEVIGEDAGKVKAGAKRGLPSRTRRTAASDDF